jgi:hypothetical protein
METRNVVRSRQVFVFRKLTLWWEEIDDYEANKSDDLLAVCWRMTSGELLQQEQGEADFSEEVMFELRFKG